MVILRLILEEPPHCLPQQLHHPYEKTSLVMGGKCPWSTAPIMVPFALQSAWEGWSWGVSYLEMGYGASLVAQG